LSALIAGLFIPANVQPWLSPSGIALLGRQPSLEDRKHPIGHVQDLARGLGTGTRVDKRHRQPERRPDPRY
jgi:hypothetical protein